MGILYKEKKITYDVMDEDPLENVFDHRDNNYLAIRRVAWNKQHPRLEIRRWYVNADEEEVPSKGISFVTEQGPHQLTHLLLKLGYGDDDTIEAIMENRKKMREAGYEVKPKSIKDYPDITPKSTASKLAEIQERIDKREEAIKYSAQNLMDNISGK